MSREDLPSPCTGRCRLDADRERCTGCARTLDEIRRWHRGSPAERAAILAAVREREAGGTTRDPETLPSLEATPVGADPVPAR